MLQIYNTLNRSKQVFTPLVSGQVKMYVCGMTVYDFCHIGHARVMIVFDMVARWLRASGYEVIYVRNITDIDDKIIARAIENGEPIAALTQRFIDAMHADSDALGLMRPDQEHDRSFDGARDRLPGRRWRCELHGSPLSWLWPPIRKIPR
jgi:cysteinyl-tRNA synthetase